MAATKISISTSFNRYLEQIKQKYLSFVKAKFPKYYERILLFGEIKINYQLRSGKSLSYSNPHNINEKMHWLHRYWKNPLVVKCADKYLMREYVKDRSCEDILIPLYGVYENANDIDFSVLPSSFVLKCNHGCGYNILCRNKDELNIKETREQLDKWMHEVFGLESYEFHYSKIKPKIICEQYLDFSSQDMLIDYKMHCINGNPEFALICTERDAVNHVVELSSYSLDWQRMDYLKNECKKDIPRPVYLEKMIEYASILSKPFPYVRIDLYSIDGKIYIGEFTFSPAGSIMDYYTDETLDMMGEKLVLPKKWNENET